MKGATFVLIFYTATVIQLTSTEVVYPERIPMEKEKSNAAVSMN